MFPATTAKRHHHHHHRRLRKREVKLQPLRGDLGLHHWNEAPGGGDADMARYPLPSNHLSGDYWMQADHYLSPTDNREPWHRHHQYRGSGAEPWEAKRRNGSGGGGHLRRRHRHPEFGVEENSRVQFVYLPPIMSPQYFPQPWGLQQQQQYTAYGREPRRSMGEKSSKRLAAARRRRPSSDSSRESDSGSAYEDERVEAYSDSAAGASIRNQRFRSIAAMSRLQQSAATVIQQEFRFYRRRKINRRLHLDRLMRHANEFFDAFIHEELKCTLVPACLIETLKSRHNEDLEAAKEKQEVLVSVADQVLTNFMNEALDECILQVFQSALNSMVKEYMATRIDLTRASEPPSLAVANDILHDWLRELLRELVPEVLDEMVVEYFDRKQVEDKYDAELHEALVSVAKDAVAESVWDAQMQEELTALTIDGIVEMKLSDMVSSITG